jgi:signal transduction histidine kinase
VQVGGDDLEPSAQVTALARSLQATREVPIRNKMTVLEPLRRALRPPTPRLGAVFLVGGGLGAAALAALPGPAGMSRIGLVWVAAGAAALGVFAWFLPWERWPWWSNLALLPPAFTLLSLGNISNGYAPYSYGSFYVVIHVWLGMAHRPGISLLVAPLTAASYLLPLLVLPGDFPVEASSIALVLPTCVIVAEVLARGRRRLLQTEAQLRVHSEDLERANRAMVERAREVRSVLDKLRKVEGQRRLLLDRTVESLEEERKSIAVELHDGPIQHLTALDFSLETVRRYLEAGSDDAAHESLVRAQELARSDVAALRTLMKGLRPPVLDDYGLETALRELTDSLAGESGVGFAVDVDLPVRPGTTLETVLYRVAQEAITNVLKHAHARRASVSVRQTADSITLDVRDDGVGFDPDRTGGNGSLGHYGLLGMQQRVEMAGGTWEIGPNGARGTWVHAVVPQAVVDEPRERDPAPAQQRPSDRELRVGRIRGSGSATGSGSA